MCPPGAEACGIGNGFATWIHHTAVDPSQRRADTLVRPYETRITLPIPRFFVSDDLTACATCQLSPDQARQSRSVLRLRPGAVLTLFNGTGVEAAATLTTFDAHGATYEVRSVSRPEREPPVTLTVGLALLRREHFDLAVQKLTELGVARITPLAAERCVVSYE